MRLTCSCSGWASDNASLWWPPTAELQVIEGVVNAAHEAGSDPGAARFGGGETRDIEAVMDTGFRFPDRDPGVGEGVGIGLPGAQAGRPWPMAREFTFSSHSVAVL